MLKVFVKTFVICIVILVVWTVWSVFKGDGFDNITAIEENEKIADSQNGILQNNLTIQKALVDLQGKEYSEPEIITPTSVCSNSILFSFNAFNKAIPI